MRLFSCSNCTNVVHFENDGCVTCGARLAFRATSLDMVALDASGTHILDHGQTEPVPVNPCANAAMGGCNWLADDGDDSDSDSDDDSDNPDVLLASLHEALVTRATTWFLHPRRMAEGMQPLIKRLSPAVAMLRARLEPAAGSPTSALLMRPALVKSP